jgi:hypothetical protein
VASAVAWSLIAINALVLFYLLRAGKGLDDLPSVLVLAAFVGVGGLLAVKQPHNAEAWLLLVVGSTSSLAVLNPFPGSWLPPLALTGTQLILRFPDGHLPSRNWSWFSRATVVQIVVLTFALSCSERLSDSGGPNPYYISWAKYLVPLILLLPVFMAVSAGSLVGRYRRADAVGREQIRWLVWAAGCVTLVYTVALLLSIRSPWGAGASVALTLLQNAALLSFVLIPVAIGFAILKRNLYDIDRLVSRTVSYVVVTGVSITIYVFTISAVTGLLSASSPFAVAAATLAAAAAFRPVLRRVRSTVDRRFNRSRYDAAATVDGFARDLRQQVGLGTIESSLVAAIHDTVSPTEVRLWLPMQE